VTQNRKSVSISRAAHPVVEMMERRQLMSASLSVSSSLMVFNAVQNSAASQTETLTLTNTGDATLTLGSGAISILNDPNSQSQEASRFTLVNSASVPSTLAPGASAVLQLNYKALAVETDTALLDISTNDPVNPVQVVNLHGIGTKGLGGSNQPSLATILRAYDIPTIVGEGPNDANAATDSIYPNPPDPSSQEVVLQRLVKAGAGPVTINVLASFTASGTHPYTLGTYTPGQPTTLSQLFTTPTAEYQSTYVQPQGATSFDPGTQQFGFYFVSNVQVTGRIGYSEDALNTWDTTNPRKIRFFPMENADGSVVPNTYIMTSTEWNAPIGYDFTNIVAVVSNVKAANGAPTGPVLGLQNLNAEPGSNTMVFSRIISPNTSLGDVEHSVGKLQVNNTGNQPLIISSYSISSNWSLVSAPKFPVTVAAGASLDLSISFNASSQLTAPYNETNSPLYPTGGALYSGTLTLNDNDPNTPTATVPLRGWNQYHSENSNEPSLQTITNLLFNWGTNINSTPIPELTESSAQGATPTYYGEEVVSAYWQAADPSLAVNVQQIAAYHTEGNTTVTAWYLQGNSGTVNKLYNTAYDDGQTLFPYAYNTSTPAAASFNSTGTFGFKVDGEFSDDNLNTLKTGGGHHFRFYPLRDSTGKLVPNAYLMTMDYSNSPQNFDFQDNAYIVTNIKPATLTTGIAAPQTTAAPATPPELFGTSTTGVNSLQWGPITGDNNLAGYKVYRATALAGPYTLLASVSTTTLAYTDTTAAATGLSYYKVTAFDANTTESLGVQTAVQNTGSTPSNPVAANESATTPYQTAVVINDFPDATDNSSGTLQPSTVTISTPAGHGSTSVNTTTGAITYTPGAGFSGTDTFQYTVGDDTGANSAPATVTITVQAPVVVIVGKPVAANLSYTAVQGLPLLIDPTSSATDSTATIDPTTVNISRTPSHGTASVNPATGAITYTATVGYSGPDSIQYTIGDSLNATSAPATISLTVAPTGPIAAAITTTASTNGTNTINVLSSAADSTANISPSGVQITTRPLHGTASVDPSTGAIIYSPADGYLGADALSYTLTDSNGQTSAPAVVTLNVGVTINTSTAKSLAFTDNLGNSVTVALSGAGSAELFFNGTGSAHTIAAKHGTGTVSVTGSGLSISDIQASATGMTSALTISRKGTASVILGGLSVSGGIGRILAPTSTLSGALSVTGALTTLQLGSASGATITVGSLGATRSGFSFASNHVVDTTLRSAMPINTLKVLDWTVSSTTDLITAPSINSLITAGNFQAALTTTGAAPFSLNNVRIAGQIDAESWNITGASNSIVVGSVAAGWTGNFTQSINAFTIRSGGFAGALSAGGINNLSISGNDTGTITAGSIRSARIVGNLTGASITVTNPVSAKVTTLGRLAVTGVTSNSRIFTNGNIGSITSAGFVGSSIDAGTQPAVTLPKTSGDFTGSATISSITVVGRGSQFTNSNIGAQLIGSLNLGVITTTSNAGVGGVGAVTINSVSAALDAGGVLRLNKAALANSSTIAAYLAAHSLNLGNFEILTNV
jgi:hypothetical protein